MRAALDGDGGLKLVERELELERIDSAIGAARSEQGQLTMVVGPAGIGKSALLRASAERARSQGLRVLTARASERESAFGFAVVRQLLERAVQGDDAPAHLFDGVAARAEGVLTGSDAVESASDADYATLQALLWVVSRLAEQDPLCLCIDDLHWADSPSLRFLTFLAPRLGDLPIVVLGSTRPAEPGTDPTLVEGLTDAPGTELVQLPPLTRQGVEAILVERAQSFTPTREVVDACHDVTGGNPFYLDALILELEDRKANGSAAASIPEVGPGRIARLIRRRCEAMPAGALELAHAMAVLEDEPPATAARVAGMPLEAAETALDCLVRGGIIRGDDRATFAHPIIRTSLYEDMPLEERRDWHLRAAQILREDRAGLQRVAPHLVLATPGADAEAPALLLDAARSASSLGAPETTVTYLKRLLEEPGLDPALAIQVELELAAALARTGSPETVARFRRVAEHPGAAPEQVCAAVSTAAMIMMFGAQSEAAVEVLDAGMARLGDREPELVDQLNSVLCVSVHTAPAARRAVGKRLEALTDQALRGQVDTPAQLASLSFELGAGWGPADKAVEFARRGLAGLPRDEVTEGTAPALCAVAGMTYGGEALEAIGWLDTMVEGARRSGALDAFVRTLSGRAFMRTLAGDFRGAEEDALASLEVELGLPHQLLGWIAWAALIEATLSRGDVVAAAKARRDLMARGPNPDAGSYQPTRVALAGIDLAEGNPRAALAVLNESRRWDADYDARPGTRHAIWRPRAAEAHAQLGEMDEAVRLAEEELSIARQHGAPQYIGRALLTRARLADENERVGYLEEAVVVMESSDASFVRAEALVDFGAMLRRKGSRTDARGALRDGLEAARAGGATVLVERATQELRAAGGRPRTPIRIGVDALTASERRICELAAQGMTNPEIAQELFLSRKTVEMHLGHSYRKLDVKRRSELPDRLDAAGKAA